jgi:hypothetical protein
MSKAKDYGSHFVGIGKGVYVLSIEADPVEWLLKKE